MEEFDLFQWKIFTYFRNVFDWWIRTKQCTEQSRPEKSGILTINQEMQLIKQ